MTKTAQIAAILERRYPCQAIPAGAQTDIAAEVGCSRELVRQVASRMGLVTPGNGAQRKAPRRACVTCGEPLPIHTKRDYHSGRCRPTMTVPCSECGSPVTRPISRILTLSRNAPRYGMNFTGDAFCNKACQGRWLGKNHGWGSPR